MFTRTIVGILVLLCSVGICAAQSFINLNFEQAVVQPQDPTFGLLEWSLAVPGWSHTDGVDTQYIYYGRTHAGLSQWFLLVDRNNSRYQPLSGRYSLAFQSGYYAHAYDAPWIYASIFQTGLIPSTARSIRFLATGDVSLSVNGVITQAVQMGTNSYAANVTSHAGLVRELRITNNNPPGGSELPPVMVDNIYFSSIPIPEPSSLLGLSLGTLALMPLRAGKRRAK